jgi:hypothetical protein
MNRFFKILLGVFQLFKTFDLAQKFLKIFDSQYLLISIQTSAKNKDKSVFFLEINHKYLQL